MRLKLELKREPMPLCKVEHFLEVFKNANNGQFLPALKIHVFGRFFSKPCLLNTNKGIDTKPKPCEAQNPKFSEYLSSSLISLVVIELIKFENRTSVVVNFCQSERDDYPVYFVLYGLGYTGQTTLLLFDARI